MSKPKIEEAPLRDFVAVLRELGREEDAVITETFYVELLTSFDYTREEIMNTPFKNLEAAAAKILNELQKNVPSPTAPQPISGNVYVGKGADNLTEDEVYRLYMLQKQILEEDKIKISMG